MNVGAFSISLNVKNLVESKRFYETIGFSVVTGEEDKNWLIMRNGEITIGLFQGMFDQNIMTFNPGWDQQCNKLENFQDIREIQKSLKSKDIQITKEVDENSTGPGSFVINDPDGNTILFDQHV